LARGENVTRLTLAVLVLAAPLAATNLDAIKSERNLEKRADLALKNARAVLDSAQEAYVAQGDMKDIDASLQEVSASVELAYDSLLETHKDPRKHSKHFKHAEIATRELLRRMRDFRDQMGVEDRDALDKVRVAVQRVHDSLLQGIMGEKKRD
jgi:hypothetical protein